MSVRYMCIIQILRQLFSRWVMSDSSATPGTIVCQAPLSMGFPRQEYQSGLPFPSPAQAVQPSFKKGEERPSHSPFPTPEYSLLTWAKCHSRHHPRGRWGLRGWMERWTYRWRRRHIYHSIILSLNIEESGSVIHLTFPTRKSVVLL